MAHKFICDEMMWVLINVSANLLHKVAQKFINVTRCIPHQPDIAKNWTSKNVLS